GATQGVGGTTALPPPPTGNTNQVDFGVGGNEAPHGGAPTEPQDPAAPRQGAPTPPPDGPGGDPMGGAQGAPPATEGHSGSGEERIGLRVRDLAFTAWAEEGLTDPIATVDEGDSVPSLAVRETGTQTAMGAAWGFVLAAHMATALRNGKNARGRERSGK